MLVMKEKSEGQKIWTNFSMGVQKWGTLRLLAVNVNRKVYQIIEDVVSFFRRGSVFWERCTAWLWRPCSRELLISSISKGKRLLIFLLTEKTQNSQNFVPFFRPKYRYPYYDVNGKGKLLYGYGGTDLYQYKSYSPLEGIHWPFLRDMQWANPNFCIIILYIF